MLICVFNITILPQSICFYQFLLHSSYKYLSDFVTNLPLCTCPPLSKRVSVKISDKKLNEKVYVSYRLICLTVKMIIVSYIDKLDLNYF